METHFFFLGLVACKSDPRNELSVKNGSRLPIWVFSSSDRSDFAQNRHRIWIQSEKTFEIGYWDVLKLYPDARKRTVGSFYYCLGARGSRGPGEATWYVFIGTVRPCSGSGLDGLAGSAGAATGVMRASRAGAGAKWIGRATWRLPIGRVPLHCQAAIG